MADVKPRTEDWKTLPWRDIQRNVFRLQQRIYRAERRGDIEVHHWDGNRLNNRYANLVLLHGHCHDEIHDKRY